MDASPTIRRRRLAARLRDLREAAGLTLDEAAARIEISKSALSRIENAKAGARVPIVRLLLEAYGVDLGLKEDLLRIAREAGQKGWWHEYSSALIEGLELLMGLEAGASNLHQFSATAVPGLLQTKEYAEVAVREHSEGEPEEVVSKRIQARLGRQGILRPGQSFEARFLLDEGVLRREVGGRRAMAGQLRHLLDLVSTDTVTIHVLPFSAGAHPAMVAPFSILEFMEGPPVVHVELLEGAVYVEAEEKVCRYHEVFDQLITIAAAPSESARIIADLYEEFIREAPRS